MGLKPVTLGILGLLALGGASFGQVNTEVFRKESTVLGISQSVKIDFDFLSGNSDSLQIEPTYRIDYVDQGWRFFSVAELSYENEGGDTSVNQGFIHGRVIKELEPTHYLEVFAQKQYDDFRRLTDRQLLGINIRVTRPEDHFSGGVGLMLENETTTLEGSTSRIRLNSYLASSVSQDNWKLSGTMYYQPATEDLLDYRVLFESTLGTMLAKTGVELNTSLKIAYDSQPPDTVNPMDISIKSGFGIRF